MFQSLISPVVYKRKPIKRAIAIITALGDYEAYLNGKRIGENLLTLEWTNYNKRVLYQTYDVPSF